MDKDEEQARSHLFLLRLWPDEEGTLQGEWSARLQHVFSGETHTFQACPQLVNVLLELSGSRNAGQELTCLCVEAPTSGRWRQQ
jgi:hypothetical protein